MGKKEKAREVAAEHEFDVKTALNTSEVLGVLDAAAAAAAPGGLRPTISCQSKQVRDDGFSTSWVMKGPGGAVQIMTFRIDGTQDGPAMVVSMKIGQFLYQKGGMFQKPTLNGGKQVRKLREIVVDELGRSLR